MNNNDEMSEKEYRDDVLALAKDAVVRVLGGEELDDVVHESVDGSAWVIYNARALRVLLYSSNENAMFEEEMLPRTGRSASLWDVVTPAAFWAMRADVLEEVERIEAEAEGEREAED